eukprot:8818039-Alexandrium_andersonii.AAC.1
MALHRLRRGAAASPCAQRSGGGASFLIGAAFFLLLYLGIYSNPLVGMTSTGPRCRRRRQPPTLGGRPFARFVAGALAR